MRGRGKHMKKQEEEGGGEGRWGGIGGQQGLTDQGGKEALRAARAAGLQCEEQKMKSLVLLWQSEYPDFN